MSYIRFNEESQTYAYPSEYGIVVINCDGSNVTIPPEDMFIIFKSIMLHANVNMPEEDLAAIAHELGCTK
ncbi:MAG: hypothetical protein ACTSQY_00805 [Candidatus Odinarchaeia archaeon]